MAWLTLREAGVPLHTLAEMLLVGLGVAVVHGLFSTVSSSWVVSSVSSSWSTWLQ